MEFLCGVCSKLGACDGNEVKCGLCENFFNTKCVKEELQAKKTRSNWKCKDCRNLSSAGSMSSTSMPGSKDQGITKDFLLRVMEEFKKEVFNEIKAFRSEMGDLTTSVQFLSESMDSANKLMADIRNDLKRIDKENANLRAQNAELQHDLEMVKERLRSVEQYSRRSNVEISGIPQTPRESVKDIIKHLGGALGFEVQEDQVAAAHRVPTYKKERTPSLVVQFQARAVRDSWISKFREKKEIYANEVNPLFPKQKVYINEHLSPDNKLFLAKLKQKCKELNFKYAWARDGKFYVRKADGEACKRIDTFLDIAKLH